MNNTEKNKLYLLILGLVIIIGFPLYIIIKNNYVTKNGIESIGTIINKEKILGGKPLNYGHYFMIKYKVEDITKIKQLSINKSIYTQYQIGDTIYLTYGKKDNNYITLSRNK